MRSARNDHKNISPCNVDILLKQYAMLSVENYIQCHPSNGKKRKGLLDCSGINVNKILSHVDHIHKTKHKECC